MDDANIHKVREALATLFLSEVEKVHLKQEKHERYLLKMELCEYLKISNNTLNKWIKRGLPRIEIAGVVRYDRKAVDRWLMQYEI